jgi:hypothetical protein
MEEEGGCPAAGVSMSALGKYSSGTCMIVANDASVKADPGSQWAAKKQSSGARNCNEKTGYL